MRNLSPRILLLVFLRTYLVFAAYNMRGLQNVGFMYVMEPGLKAIHGGDRAALRQARGRYVRHYNCHPFCTPFLAGMYLRTEGDMAKGLLPEHSFAAVKDTAAYTLSAIGDSVFGGTLLVTWGLLCCFLVIGGQSGAALAVTGLLFLGLQFFKFCAFVTGFQYGLTALFWLKRLDLINWGDRFKLLNAFLLLLLLAQLVPEDEHPGLWALAVICATLAAWLTAKHIPRTLLALAATAAILLFT